MKIYRFYGYSDDNLEISGAERQEKPASGCVASVILRSPTEGSLIVTGVYAPNDIADTWCIGVSPIKEGTPIPDWKISFALHRKGHSAEMTVECPDDVVLDMLWEFDES